MMRHHSQFTFHDQNKREEWNIIEKESATVYKIVLIESVQLKYLINQETRER
jgi:hypothetical protein